MRRSQLFAVLSHTAARHEPLAAAAPGGGATAPVDADRANARAHAGLMTAKPPWLVLLYFTPSDKSDVFKI